MKALRVVSSSHDHKSSVVTHKWRNLNWDLHLIFIYCFTFFVGLYAIFKCSEYI